MIPYKPGQLYCDKEAHEELIVIIGVNEKCLTIYVVFNEKIEEWHSKGSRGSKDFSLNRHYDLIVDSNNDITTQKHGS